MQLPSPSVGTQGSRSGQAALHTVYVVPSATSPVLLPVPVPHTKAFVRGASRAAHAAAKQSRAWESTTDMKGVFSLSKSLGRATVVYFVVI